MPDRKAPKQWVVREWIEMGDNIPSVIWTLFCVVIAAITFIYSGAHFITWEWNGGAPIRSVSIGIIVLLIWTFTMFTREEV